MTAIYTFNDQNGDFPKKTHTGGFFLLFFSFFKKKKSTNLISMSMTMTDDS
jgi:hypothetical protein